MSCAICQKRRPRRYCPGVRGDICPVCCGTEREQTVRCPLDCEYLMEARKHERSGIAGPAEIPHPDIPLSEEFVEENTALIAAVTLALADEAGRSGALDADVREALASLIETYRTLQQSGLIYERLPANRIAADLYRVIKAASGEFLAEERQALGMPRTRDADILRALVFLHVYSIERNNGRKYGRSFLDALRPVQPPGGGSAGAEVSGSSLILP